MFANAKAILLNRYALFPIIELQCDYLKCASYKKLLYCIYLLVTENPYLNFLFFYSILGAEMSIKNLLYIFWEENICKDRIFGLSEVFVMQTNLKFGMFSRNSTLTDYSFTKTIWVSILLVNLLLRIKKKIRTRKISTLKNIYIALC